MEQSPSIHKVCRNEGKYAQINATTRCVNVNNNLKPIKTMLVDCRVEIRNCFMRKRFDWVTNPFNFCTNWHKLLQTGNDPISLSFFN